MNLFTDHAFNLHGQDRAFFRGGIGQGCARGITLAVRALMLFHAFYKSFNFIGSVAAAGKMRADIIVRHDIGGLITNSIRNDARR
ncbi:MAG: hypothetical protein Q7K71_04895, partial [Candidatus Omnitrophota bacterium]|nr:hypothetical protein [Candidatus Omnitrophota bacterium]